MEDAKLTSNSKLIMGCEFIFKISDIFANTFLVAYFFELTSQNLRVTSVYYLIAYIIVGLCFWAMGDIIKTKNKLAVYRVGILLNCLYIFFLLILGDKVRDLYGLLGVVYGLSQGVYWVACHNIISSLNKNTNSKKYVTTRNIFNNIISIVFPFIIGTSIHFTSFTSVAIAIFTLTFIQMILSFCIKEKTLTTSSYINFNLLAYFSHLKKLGSKAKGIFHYYYAEFFSAIVENAMSTLVTVMIMMTFSSTLDLGILTTIFSVCTIITIFLFSKFYCQSNYKKYIIICAIFMFFSTLILVFDINKASVIIYNFCNSIFIVILSNIVGIQRYNSITNINLSENLSEHQAFLEISLACGRIFAYGALLIVSFFSSTIAFSILLLLFALCIIPYVYHVLMMEKQK